MKNKITANQRAVMTAHMQMASKLLADGTVTKAQYNMMVKESKKNVLGVKNGK